MLHCSGQNRQARFLQCSAHPVLRGASRHKAFKPDCCEKTIIGWEPALDWAVIWKNSNENNWLAISARCGVYNTCYDFKPLYPQTCVDLQLFRDARRDAPRATMAADAAKRLP